MIHQITFKMDFPWDQEEEPDKEQEFDRVVDGLLEYLHACVKHEDVTGFNIDLVDGE